MSMSIIDSQEPVYREEHEIDVLTKRIAELEANDGTRWHELFGTPERTARTIADTCSYHGSFDCSYGCPADGSVCGCGDYDALLEWLRGDAE